MKSTAIYRTLRRIPTTLRRRLLAASEDLSALRARCPEFYQVREQIRQAGTDNLSHFGNGYTHEGGLFLQQNPDEFAALCLFLKTQQLRHNYVEIGSASGGACLFLQRHLGFDHLLSLDDGQHPRAAEQPRHFRQIANFKQFVGDSHSLAARDFLKNNLAGEIDIAFIDGDHSYKGICQDIDLVLPHCKPGTLLIFHDTRTCWAVEHAWLRAVQKQIVKPLAEYIGPEKPLGIAVGAVL